MHETRGVNGECDTLLNCFQSEILIWNSNKSSSKTCHKEQYLDIKFQKIFLFFQLQQTNIYRSSISVYILTVPAPVKIQPCFCLIKFLKPL